MPNHLYSVEDLLKALWWSCRNSKIHVSNVVFLEVFPSRQQVGLCDIGLFPDLQDVAPQNSEIILLCVQEVSLAGSLKARDTAQHLKCTFPASSGFCKSQHHRMGQAGKDFWKASSPASLLKESAFTGCWLPPMMPLNLVPAFAGIFNMYEGGFLSWVAV